MSPSRRDVFKSLAIATAAVVLPKQALTTPDTFASDATIDGILDGCAEESGQILDAIVARITTHDQEVDARLVQQAITLGVWLEASGGEYIARRPDRPGECELVTWNKCTCHRYSVWHRCEHVALVRSIVA